MGFYLKSSVCLFIIQKQLIRRLCHYEVLGVSQTASIKEIRSAYLVQAKKCHPDTDSDNKKLHMRFIAINEAYNILSKPDLRKLYDDSLRSYIVVGMPQRMRNYPYADYEPPQQRNYEEPYTPFNAPFNAPFNTPFNTPFKWMESNLHLYSSKFTFLLILCHVVLPLYFMISLLMVPSEVRKKKVQQMRRELNLFD